MSHNQEGGVGGWGGHLHLKSWRNIHNISSFQKGTLRPHFGYYTLYLPYPKKINLIFLINIDIL